MICKLCSADRKLVRAHIVPEAFFRIGRGSDNEALVMASSDPNTPPKRRPIGVYDPELVCGECERCFQEWDAYAADLFINRFEAAFKPWVADGEPIAFVADGVDYERLKMFVISLLWRATATSQEYFSRVNIGPWQEIARESVLNATAGDAGHFATVFSRWIAPEELQTLTNAHMSPFCERWDGINAVRLYLGPIVAYVKVDRRPFASAFAPLALSPGGPLAVVAREIHTSKDLRAMRRVADNLERWQQ